MKLSSTSSISTTSLRLDEIDAEAKHETRWTETTSDDQLAGDGDADVEAAAAIGKANAKPKVQPAKQPSRSLNSPTISQPIRRPATRSRQPGKRRHEANRVKMKIARTNDAAGDVGEGAVAVEVRANRKRSRATRRAKTTGAG